MAPNLFYATILVLVATSNGGKVVTKGSGEWTHQVDLEEDYGIKFRWRNTPSNEEGERWLIMQFSARATGYVGVGFSPHGGMAGGDMAIAWRDSNGTPKIIDFHGYENGPPVEDAKQDYSLLDFEEKHGWTTFSFKRRWDTCDDSDIKLTNDTMRLIWSYSDTKPTIKAGKFQALYHGPTNRGARSVILGDGGAYPPFPDEKPGMYPGVKIWDFTVEKVRVDPKNTTYYCKILKFTDTDKKHHLIGWKPIIQRENRNIVHHIVIYECSVPPHEVPIFERFHKSNTGGVCFTPNMPSEWGKNCVVFSFAWVVGSEGEMFPDHVGSPLGEEHGGATYFMIEMHYENYFPFTATDSSGIRMFYTDNLRKYDGGTLLVGYRHSPFLLIPPQQSDFMINGVCGSECTSKAMPETGINVTNTLVHLHLVGKKIRLRHFRNGIELPLIAEDNHYDFNYQQSRTLKHEITILPGDELVTECEYQTKEVDNYVIGGLATSQEMCQVFFFYYPRIPLSQCTSQYEFYDFLKGLEVDGVVGKVLKALHMPYEPNLLPPEDREKDVADDARELEAIAEGISYKGVFNFINITSPSKLRGRTVGQWLDEMRWTDKRGKDLERFWKDGTHYQFCSKPGMRRVVLDKHIIRYPVINQVLRHEDSAVCKRESILWSASSASFAFTNGFLSYFFVLQVTFATCSMFYLSRLTE